MWLHPPKSVKFANYGDKDENPSSATFVYNCQRIYQSLLSIPRVRQLLMDADSGLPGSDLSFHPAQPTPVNLFGLTQGGGFNPLDSVSKLTVVVVKCRSSNDVLEWCVELLLDFAKSGALTAEQVGCRSLEGIPLGI